MMYTNLKTVQIIIALLKKHNIKHLVISPGTRNTPLVHSVENDDFFVCYSIVDERSAGYFALGIAEALDVPVCVTCTAATATCNYLPAMKEAYERNICLVALTADRNQRFLYHMQDQSIDQVNMYGKYARHAVNLPELNAGNEKYSWYVEREVNEAFLELDHHVKGPVQINYEVIDLGNFSCDKLPEVRKISRHGIDCDWKKYADYLSKKKRILLICGQNHTDTEALSSEISEFEKKFNVVVSYDYFSNIYGENFLKLSNVVESLTSYDNGLIGCDLVISIGTQVWSGLKYSLVSKAQHWCVDPQGRLSDGFITLTDVFESTPLEFFKNINAYANGTNDHVYYNEWKNRLSKAVYPDLRFTNFYVIGQFVKNIPKDSILHLSILNSIRITNYFTLDPSVRVFGNLGCDGIDGPFSTFLGQACKTDKEAFLITGDLSFIYDINAAVDKISDNVHILVINNFAGAEFHKNFGLKQIPTLNTHIAASHHTKISQLSHLADFRYLSAENSQQLEEGIAEFIKPSQGPVILEVFTDADTDAAVLKQFWDVNKIYTKKSAFKKKVGKILRKLHLIG